MTLTDHPSLQLLENSEVPSYLGRYIAEALCYTHFERLRAFDAGSYSAYSYMQCASGVVQDDMPACGVQTRLLGVQLSALCRKRQADTQVLSHIQNENSIVLSVKYRIP